MESMREKKPWPRRSFTSKFKAEIVDLCQQGDRSVGQVAADFGLTEIAVREWVKQAESDAGTRIGGSLTGAEWREPAELRSVNRRLREDVEILKRAANCPDTVLAGRATSLFNQSLRLAGLGQQEEALAAVVETARIYRQLATERPDAYQTDLARSLAKQGFYLHELGRQEQALAAVAEAAAIFRPLAAERPDAFLPYLAAALNNQSEELIRLGRTEEALAAAQEATGIFRQLASLRPDSYVPYFAVSLDTLAEALSALGQHAQAEVARTEGESLRRFPAF